jgi:hypothetical protein
MSYFGMKDKGIEDPIDMFDSLRVDKAFDNLSDDALMEYCLNVITAQEEVEDEEHVVVDEWKEAGMSYHDFLEF